jgi:hypothetical protein
VPQDLLAIIRQYGGKMKETYGVPVEEIQEAIKYGVRKINIDTDIRLAMTGAVRKFLAENPEKFDAREWLKPAREAAKQICKQRYIEFGCEGQAGKIKGDSAAGRGQPSTPGRAGPGGQLSRCHPSPAAPGRRFAKPRAQAAAGFFLPLPQPMTCPPPCTPLCPHLPAAAGARQGARQLRGGRRPHPDGRQRPLGLRRDHGRAHSRQGRAADADGAVLVRKLGHIVPNHLTGEAPKAWSRPTRCRRCAAARCWSSA